MSTSDDVCRNTVLGILAEIQVSGRRGVARTTLVKYVYLLDVFVAEEKNGERTWSGLEWFFLHYGPYSAALGECLSRVESLPYIDIRESEQKDREFILYSLAPDAKVKSLSDIGVSNYAVERLNQVIREYSGSLSQLLDHVYFHTIPMRGATPKQKLSFHSCRKVNFKDEIRPLTLLTPNPGQVDRIRQLMSTIKNRNLPPKPVALDAAIYDEHYQEAMGAGDAADDAFHDMQPINAALTFRSDPDDDWH